MKTWGMEVPEYGVRPPVLPFSKYFNIETDRWYDNKKGYRTVEEDTSEDQCKTRPL